MLQQFTWQQFLIAALVLTLIWYAAVTVLFYRKEFKAFLNGKKKEKQKAEPLPHWWDYEDEQVEDENEQTLLGASKLPEGMGTVSMSEFGFTPSDDVKEDQVGLVPDVLEEVKSVLNIIVKGDGSKTDFFNLMKLVSEKYPKVGSNSDIEYINEFIADHAPFHISAEELENLWV